MNDQLSENGKDLVKYMPQAVNALADRLLEKLEEQILYGAKPQTNADRIRAMSDEELATFFGTLPCCPPGNADELCFPDNTCGADTKMMGVPNRGIQRVIKISPKYYFFGNRFVTTSGVFRSIIFID